MVGSIAPTAGPSIGSGIPARISTVTGQQIDAWEPRLLADALATQPGISLYDDLGSAYKLNLSTRGFNVGPVVGLPPGVSVFLDGVRQNEPDAAEVNFDLLPMEHVRRVELLERQRVAARAQLARRRDQSHHPAGQRTPRGRTRGVGRVVRRGVRRGIGLRRHAGPDRLLRRGRL